MHPSALSTKRRKEIAVMIDNPRWMSAWNPKIQLLKLNEIWMRGSEIPKSGEACSPYVYPFTSCWLDGWSYFPFKEETRSVKNAHEIVFIIHGNIPQTEWKRWWFTSGIIAAENPQRIWTCTRVVWTRPGCLGSHRLLSPSIFLHFRPPFVTLLFYNFIKILSWIWGIVRWGWVKVVKWK